MTLMQMCSIEELDEPSNVSYRKLRGTLGSEQQGLGGVDEDQNSKQQQADNEHQHQHESGKFQSKRNRTGRSRHLQYFRQRQLLVRMVFSYQLEGIRAPKIQYMKLQIVIILLTRISIYFITLQKRIIILIKLSQGQHLTTFNYRIVKESNYITSPELKRLFRRAFLIFRAGSGL
ncbi:Hypothetical_protein [Hexamita inflata]|uniref:Hypothetical_protein n=1 Tax=Hexamita inflata TaxID=28002 RepID=A0AA86PSR0_9EUKA|nr:Hypothetical protein HINF_LOCUS28480 [Hexamita inflata]